MCGGLGNQMFQYACYMKLKSIGKEVKFDDVTSYELDNARPIQLAVFGLDYPRATRNEVTVMRDSSPALKDKIRRKIRGRNLKQYIENNYCYDEKIFNMDDIYLIGYYQSEKYFKNIENEIRKAFTFRRELFAEWCLKVEEAILDTPESVSIHIRRGDYTVSDGDNIYADICTDEYYEAALSYIIDKYPDARFYLFTNDHKWASYFIMQHSHLSITEVIGSTEYTGYQDMYLMSRCKHHVIANSSFSWWGAYLGNQEGITIAPKPWLNSEYCSDIHTENMICIDSEGNVLN